MCVKFWFNSIICVEVVVNKSFSACKPLSPEIKPTISCLPTDLVLSTNTNHKLETCKKVITQTTRTVVS